MRGSNPFLAHIFIKRAKGEMENAAKAKKESSNARVA
jgi:hypothetical protein